MSEPRSTTEAQDEQSQADAAWLQIVAEDDARREYVEELRERHCECGWPLDEHGDHAILNPKERTK
jgi:hypothetical protein